MMADLNRMYLISRFQVVHSLFSNHSLPLTISLSAEELSVPGHLATLFLLFCMKIVREVHASYFLVTIVFQKSLNSGSPKFGRLFVTVTFMARN